MNLMLIVFCAVGMKLLVRTVWSRRCKDCAWLYHSRLLVCSRCRDSAVASWLLVPFARAMFTSVGSIEMAEHHAIFDGAWHVRLCLAILLLCDCSVQCVWMGLESWNDCMSWLFNSWSVFHFFPTPAFSALPFNSWSLFHFFPTPAFCLASVVLWRNCRTWLPPTTTPRRPSPSLSAVCIPPTSTHSWAASCQSTTSG